jgi:hypothetical protein
MQAATADLVPAFQDAPRITIAPAGTIVEVSGIALRLFGGLKQMLEKQVR